MLILHRPPSAVGQGAEAQAHRLRRTETRHRQTRAAEARRVMRETRRLRFGDHIAAMGLIRLPAEQPQLLAPARRVTTPSRTYPVPRETCRPMGWPAPRAAAYPIAAAWSQRPSRHRMRRAWMAQRQPEKPAPAARERTRWPCESTAPHREANPRGRCCSRPPASFRLSAAAESSALF